jgi:hypothetical protein
MLKAWTAACLMLIACTERNAPKPSKDDVHDAGAHAHGNHDAGAHDAAAGSDAMRQPDATADAGAPLSCDDRARAIGEQVIAAIAGADDHCETDADCVTLQPLTNSCYQGCTLPIARRGVDAIDGALKTLERDTCPQFLQAGCTAPQPQCTMPPAVSCQSGTCKTMLDPMARTCPNLEQAMTDRIIQAFQFADRHCTVDADCTMLVPMNACFKDCRNGLILSDTGATSVQQVIESAEVDLCPAFYASGCGFDDFECGPPDTNFGCIGRTCGPSGKR